MRAFKFNSIKSGVFKIIILGLLCGATPAFAAKPSIFDVDNTGEQMPSTDEYNEIPVGVMLPNEQQAIAAAEAAKTVSEQGTGQQQTFVLQNGNAPNAAAATTSGTNGAPTVPTISPPGAPDTAAGADYTRKLNYDSLIELYREGKYEQIVPTLQGLAASGHQGAQEILGIMYRQGQGVSKDPAKALDLLNKAALANRPLAQHHLGIMYFLGEGVPKDAVTALMWLDIAILHYPDGPEKQRAKEDRDNIYPQLTRRDKDRATLMVRDWLNQRGEGHLMDLQQ